MEGKRVVWAKQLPEVYKKLDEIDQIIGGHLEVGLLELVKLRSSMLNGCAFCVDLHTQKALKEGDTQQRVIQISTWHEAGGLFTGAERAALALTDEMTGLGDRGVSDEAYEEVAEHFDDQQIAALMAAISMINLYNRLAVTSELRPKQR